ncbi:hypothetical protein ACLB2K_031524 [Fragaria x ananassa]
MAKHDLNLLLNLNPRPSKQPKIHVESDVHLAFKLQMQEAMAASLAIKPSTWFLRKEAAELEARVEGLNEAICLKFKNVKFFCDDILLYNHVINLQLPRPEMLATLLNQVTSLRKKFAYCNPRLVASGDIKFAVKFAIEAIDSQITLSAETSKANKLPCTICFEDTHIGGMYSIDHCLHRYCLSCMKKHVEVKFQTGMMSQCPQNDYVDSSFAILVELNGRTKKQHVSAHSGLCVTLSAQYTLNFVYGHGDEFNMT